MKRETQQDAPSEITGLSLTVCENIRRLRKTRGWPQVQVAREVDKLGIPMQATALSRLEKGINGIGNPARITVEQLVAFAEVFSVGPLDLLAEPTCGACNNAPPHGFACRTCGAEA